MVVVQLTIASGSSKEEYWMIQWRTPQYKKHKTWDGDAVLVLNGARGTMYDLEGKFWFIERAQSRRGGEHQFGGKEIGIDNSISRADYLSGRCFGRGSKATSGLAVASTLAIQKQFIPLKPSNLTTPYKAPTIQRQAIDLQPVALLAGQSHTAAVEPQGTRSCWTANWRKPQGKKHKTWDGDAFVQHVGNKLTVISEKGKIIGRKEWDGLPLYNGYRFHAGVDPEVDGREKLPFTQYVTLPQARSSTKENVPQATITESVCSASGFLRSTSQEEFEYPLAEGAVVMKAPTKEHSDKFNKKGLPIVAVVIDPVITRYLRPHQIEGVRFLYECVMGLRKHEGQGCILADDMCHGAEQNPYGGGAVLGKVLIVCPVSLINNWRAEFRKWLGRDRIGVLAGDKDKSQIKQFVNSRVHQVLVIGYEKLRSVIPPIGMIICDEGHRLKSANNKTSMMFKALRTPRRIILSGTPIQNDLSEFHAMANDYNTFRRVYEAPILKSRAPDRTEKEFEIGEARSAQLSTIAKSFVLRREATLLKKYLPPKQKLDTLIEGSTAESLALIGMLTKVSNSPVLLKAQVDKARASKGEPIVRPGVMEAVKLLPERAQIEDFSLSDRYVRCSWYLRWMINSKQHTEEKCIIVSHYTSTLNVIEAFCKKQSYTYFRLDGQTPAAKRQEYVNVFNSSSQRNHCTLFLLSSKAGGVGLNLIGASRLCLIDSDWNPSDGQKRPVFIYRFLTAGTIDEKIFQRQVTKIGLSNSLMGNVRQFQLRDIFRIQPDTACNTHDLLGCESGLAALGEWTHINCLRRLARNDVHDDVPAAVPSLRGRCGRTKTSNLSQQSQKSRLESSLSAVGLDNISSMDDMTPLLSVRDVPGGTISFLFEKVSTTNLDDDDAAAQPTGVSAAPY
ncbi:P-loop containing nucleoside triphosphate hydrolase protein [Melanogaster broomeanus]|nr:P-loop containing nucleoside triphosphate hydrolase protein [Melanogaster broomeanus]